MNFFTLFISYVFAFCLTFLLFVYSLNLPLFIAQDSSLVNEYYYKNAASTIPLDFFLIIAYLLVAAFFIWILDVRGGALQIVVVLFTTLVISGIFMMYFLWSGGPSTNFFSRWFHKVGFRAVAYDMILLAIVFLIMMTFYKMISSS